MARSPVWARARPRTILTSARSTIGESRRGLFALGIAATLVVRGVTQQAQAQDAQGVCTGAPLLSTTTGSSQIPSACTLPAGSVALDTLYYQNASKIGGTALAAYPVTQLNAGVTGRLDVVFDPPAQIAESGLHGGGLYPRSRFGYGLRYRVSRTARMAFTAGLTIAPPASLYAPDENQSKVLLDIDSAYYLTPGLTIKGLVQASTSRILGVGRVLPAQAVGADISLSPSTVVSPDVGLRSVTARVQPQSFADLCVKRSLDRTLMVDVGLGTAFNPVARAKAHYLAAGLSFKH